MEKEKQNQLYELYSDLEANISDNKVRTPEHVFRDYLQHAYEEGFRLGSKHPYPIVDISASAAVTCVCSACASWGLGHTAEALVWFAIAAGLAAVAITVHFLYSINNTVDPNKMCESRDAAVDKYVNLLFSKATSMQTRDADNHTGEHDGAAQ